ncbi:MAG: LicD family protein [Bifidobacteriaceae bacterium]|nr:LicD family protein [Bifidobacteriaceae bacterium]
MHRIKSLMPVSSRSFHDFEHHVNAELRGLKRLANASDPKTEIRFWALFQRDGETQADAKRRFFSLIPKASGDMALLQKAQTKILRELREVCEANGIQYLATGGTLIGAERHQGFIPWDDDLDVAMSRDDLAVLTKALENSTTHRIVTVWDYRAVCEQIRFRTTDPNNPAFVDLFIFDWTSEPTLEMFQRSQEYRKRMKSEIHEKFRFSEWPGIWMMEDSNPLSAQVREEFAKYRAEELQESYVTDREHAKGMYRSIENFDDPTHFPYIGPMSDWFPAREMQFEDIQIWTPNNKDKFLDGPYGDIWELPNDIDSHFQHVSRKELEEDAVRQALESYIAE